MRVQGGRSGDAAHYITDECERLFCESLGNAFLVEKDASTGASLVMGAHIKDRAGERAVRKSAGHVFAVKSARLPTPSSSPEQMVHKLSGSGFVREYMEIYDYHNSGTRFRGFVAEKDGERAMFAFFENEVIGQDLKPGYVLARCIHRHARSSADIMYRLTALLELASTDGFDCSQLVICLDRTADHEATADLTKDLGWVGFELTMLDQWSGQECTLSDRWLFMAMDV